MPDILEVPGTFDAPAPSVVGTLRLPDRVHFGHGSRGQLPRILPMHGSRVLAVVDPFLVGSRVLDDLVASLIDAGQKVRVHADITPELPVDTIDAGAAVAREHGTEVIVAIGGGSALDAAKLIALLCSYDGPLSRYYGENLVPGAVLPVVAVPTTAGTGSEVTPVAVVSDPERELKVGVSSPFLVPVAAVVDPDLTLGAPAAVTAYSGIDALVHAVESYTARPLEPDWTATAPVFTGHNALTEPLALRAATHLAPWLPVAFDEPGHRVARGHVAQGSLLAGIAFGATGTHLCHAMQYPIGALTKTQHGLGTGLLLPYVIDVLRADPSVAERLARFGAALEELPPGAASAERTLARVVEINDRIGIPTGLAEIGIERDQLPHIADLTLQSARLLAISPVDPSRELLLDLLERAHHGHLGDRSPE